MGSGLNSVLRIHLRNRTATIGVHVIEYNEDDEYAEELPEVRRNRSAKIIFGGALIALAAIATTVAANITINAGKKAEFGQGLFRIAACDQWVGIKPTYTAATYPGGTSRVNGMHIMGLDAANCKGVNFKIQFYQTGVATALDIFVDKNGANSNRVMLSVCKVCTITTNQQRLDAVSLINSSGQNIGYGDGIEYIDFEVTTGDYIWLLENGATPLATNSAINRTTVESASY